jgi:hypothetical protein
MPTFNGVTISAADLEAQGWKQTRNDEWTFSTTMWKVRRTGAGEYALFKSKDREVELFNRDMVGANRPNLDGLRNLRGLLDTVIKEEEQYA